MDKIKVFGKSLNKPSGISGPSAPIPEPFGGISSGVFAVFAVVILTLSIATYMPGDDEENLTPNGLTSSQSSYLENILSDRSRSSPTLSSYDTCGFLEMDLKEHLKEEMRVNLGTGSYYYGGGWLEDDMMVDNAMEMDGATSTADSAPSSGGSPKNSPGGEQGVDFSGTNNQEQGVDEADFVKTDGSFVYMINKGYSDYGKYPSGKLHILDIPEAGNISYLSNISIEGRPTEMLLVDDKAVVYSNVQIYSYYEDKHILDDIVKKERKAPISIDSSTQSTASSDEDIDSSEEIIMDYDYGYYYRTTSFTKLTVLDLTNRSSPQITKELYIEGNYQTARESGGTVRMVSYGWMEIDGLKTWLDFSDYRTYWELDWDSSKREQIWMEVMNETIEYNDKVIDQTPLDDLLPRIHEKLDNNITTHKYTESGDGNCQNFAAASDTTGQGLTSVMTLDLLDENFSFNADHILSNWATVYASGDVMVMAEASQSSWWFWGDEESDFQEMTNLHVFDISNPGQTDYIASGRINGTIQDQFSLSEHNGNIRVCSTTGQWGRWWMDDPEPMLSHVFVLGLNADETEYEVIGKVGDIAPDESIWSARFVGDKAYIVTFRNIDPLWTIDLSEPNDPRIIGELKIPGVSTYIHPVGDTHLLTIGIAGDDDGLDWGVTQISFFDVSDFSNPILESELKLNPAPNGENGWSYSHSEATYEHKAFQYWESDGLLAIPLSTSRWVENSVIEDGKTYNYYGYEYVSKLMLISATPEKPLEIYNDNIDHSSYYDSRFSWDTPSIKRSIFMGGGDYIYAISEKAITAHNVLTMAKSGSVELPSDKKPIYDRYFNEEEPEAPPTEEEESRASCENQTIEGRWVLSGLGGSTLYQFEDGLRYTFYIVNGTFGDVPIPGAKSYEVDGENITIDLHHDNLAMYRMNFSCDGQIVQFYYNDNESSDFMKSLYGEYHSTLYRESYFFETLEELDEEDETSTEEESS
ncbi:MAG: hypothetical protein BEU02_00895 [Marine Group III euryarchaeote CG-Epi5]|uniref:Beta propeller domain-containing protein n=1 Tax=Marine Group III euryarchaeote CG-Epi5 TaxID=1888999 RepID=A0A1J5TZC5_9ARCH|nr:MAG: hypothetical protein BEU02_00895 [Marine Group III euryarchaeote CG-Epi5]